MLWIWSDAIYVSFDGAFDSASTLLGTVTHNGALAAGQSYNASASVTLPVGVTGNATFFVVTDYYQQIYEPFRAGDTRGAAAPTNVMLTPPPDLVAAVDSAPMSALAAHAVQLTYTVTNEGSTATPNYSWTDSVYLSNTPTLSGSATLLTTATHYGVLDVGQSYTASPHRRTPRRTGLARYYLIVQTNSNNAGL